MNEAERKYREDKVYTQLDLYCVVSACVRLSNGGTAVDIYDAVKTLRESYLVDESQIEGFRLNRTPKTNPLQKGAGR